MQLFQVLKIILGQLAKGTWAYFFSLDLNEVKLK